MRSECKFRAINSPKWSWVQERPALANALHTVQTPQPERLLQTDRTALRYGKVLRLQLEVPGSNLRGVQCILTLLYLWGECLNGTFRWSMTQSLRPPWNVCTMKHKRLEQSEELTMLLHVYIMSCACYLIPISYSHCTMCFVNEALVTESLRHTIQSV
jgi:hypothetical protein